ncbi:MAG: hypothetical protein ACK5N8_01245 [Alphaproteobacteria bacterium]
MEEILEKMLKQCSEAGLFPTKNINKVARAKSIMFSKEEWKRCPCDASNSQRSCISEMCKNDIETKGVCHCNCYAKEKQD